MNSRRRVNSTVRCYFINMATLVLNQAKLSSDAVARIAEELSTQDNLKDVMAWALSQPGGTFIPSVVAELIVQDEFTHDVIVPWRDGLVLVYDTT